MLSHSRTKLWLSLATNIDSSVVGRAFLPVEDTDGQECPSYAGTLESIGWIDSPLLSRRGQILYRTAKEIPQSLVFLFPDQRVGNERQALAFDELAEVE